MRLRTQSHARIGLGQPRHRTDLSCTHLRHCLIFLPIVNANLLHLFLHIRIINCFLHCQRPAGQLEISQAHAPCIPTNLVDPRCKLLWIDLPAGVSPKSRQKLVHTLDPQCRPEEARKDFPPPDGLLNPRNRNLPRFHIFIQQILTTQRKLLIEFTLVL